MKNHLRGLARGALLVLVLASALVLSAERVELEAKDLPEAVVKVLNQYLDSLATSKTLDECAVKVFPIFAGHLVSQAGGKVAADVLAYSLKKDYENVKFYKLPAEITRVQLVKGSYDGFGKTLVEGDIYKIWIAKKEGVAGLPAPIPVIVPAKDAEHPKIVSTIGSL